jgi:hypothetical protein
MVMDGLIEEAAKLHLDGLCYDHIAGRAIGYRDAISFIKKEISFYDFLKLFMRRTRNYVRRQECWFRNKGYFWIDSNEYDPVEVIHQYINGIVNTDIHDKSYALNRNCFKKTKEYKSELRIFNDEEKVKSLIKRVEEVLREEGATCQHIE